MPVLSELLQTVVPVLLMGLALVVGYRHGYRNGLKKKENDA